VFLPGNRRSVLVRLIMIAAATGLFAVGYQWGNRFQHHGGPPAIAGILVSPPIDLSDFSLRDPDGRPVTRERLAQGWSLLTYGDLTRVQGHLAVNRLLDVYNWLADHPELRAALHLVLVQTSDAPNLARDFNRLSPALIVAGGEPAELAKLADALGGAPEPTPGDDAGAALYLIAPDARLVALFTPGQGPATMAADLVTLSERPDVIRAPREQIPATNPAPLPPKDSATR
jgi:hypothetical protein